MLQHAGLYMAITVAFALFLNSVFAVAGTFSAESLPTEVRYSGLVFVREVNGVMFAGTSPFIATLLVGGAGTGPGIWPRTWRRTGSPARCAPGGCRRPPPVRTKGATVRA
ncbi:hypothetical protein GT030_21910 [Streptomyces sp. SID1328]|uniref:MHS family MFS transporter n=1 Tax=Streptomyces sp. SID1328 TaxID=2690250 RepID=UPI0013717695|nr:MHS family MFS transporter [Streptomyces sp. SID1328]MYV41449.1 hypothetical protein [Streptomyces sp. SID1328]